MLTLEAWIAGTSSPRALKLLLHLTSAPPWDTGQPPGGKYPSTLCFLRTHCAIQAVWLTCLSGHLLAWQSPGLTGQGACRPLRWSSRQVHTRLNPGVNSSASCAASATSMWPHLLWGLGWLMAVGSEPPDRGCFKERVLRLLQQDYIRH